MAETHRNLREKVGSVSDECCSCSVHVSAWSKEHVKRSSKRRSSLERNKLFIFSLNESQMTDKDKQ